MRGSRHLGYVVVGLVVLLSFGGTAMAQTPVRVDKVSRSSVDVTAQQLGDAVGANRLMVVQRIDHQGHMKMGIQMEIKGSQTFHVFSPMYGKPIFETDPAAGLEIPLTIYVYERADSKAVVSYYRPSSLFARYKRSALDDMAKEMDKVLAAIVEAATK